MTQFNTESSTRWLCWPSRIAQRHSTDIPQSSHQDSSQWTDTSLVYRTSHYLTSRSRFARTDFARRAFRCSAPTVWMSGTRCQGQKSVLAHCLYLNRGLKRTSSARVLLTIRSLVSRHTSGRHACVSSANILDAADSLSGIWPLLALVLGQDKPVSLRSHECCMVTEYCSPTSTVAHVIKRQTLPLRFINN